MFAHSEEEFFESCLHEVLAKLWTKGFNFALKLKAKNDVHCAIFFKGRILIMAVFPTGFGKTLAVFQLLVLMLEVKSTETWRSWLCQYNCRFTASKYHPRPGFGG